MAPVGNTNFQISNALHVLVLIDAPFGVTASNLSQRLVLVATGALIFHMKNVIGRHMLFILHRLQVGRQRLKRRRLLFESDERDKQRRPLSLEQHSPRHHQRPTTLGARHRHRRHAAREKEKPTPRHTPHALLAQQTCISASRRLFTSKYTCSIDSCGNR